MRLHMVLMPIPLSVQKERSIAPIVVVENVCHLSTSGVGTAHRVDTLHYGRKADSITVPDSPENLRFGALCLPIDVDVDHLEIALMWLRFEMT